MKVVNLFSGPGSGKSTTAAGLFFNLKVRGYNAELVTEFAKQLVWQERHAAFKDQLYIFAKQNSRLESLRGKVSHVITDSPLLLSNIYAPDDYIEGFEDVVKNVFNSYNNINFFIKRVKTYNPVGRNETEEAARAVDIKMQNMLNTYGVKYDMIEGDEAAPRKIFDKILLDEEAKVCNHCQCESSCS
jgi:hypothetical protein